MSLPESLGFREVRPEMSDDTKLIDLQHMKNPPSWKDWLALAGTLLTIAVVLVQGGRILESLDNTKIELKAVIGVVSTLKDEASSLRTEIAIQKGVDALHAEQIKGLHDRIEMTKPQRRN